MPLPLLVALNFPDNIGLLILNTLRVGFCMIELEPVDSAASPSYFFFRGNPPPILGVLRMESDWTALREELPPAPLPWISLMVRGGERGF